MLILIGIAILIVTIILLIKRQDTRTVLWRSLDGQV